MRYILILIAISLGTQSAHAYISMKLPVEATGQGFKPDAALYMEECVQTLFFQQLCTENPQELCFMEKGHWKIKERERLVFLKHQQLVPTMVAEPQTIYGGDPVFKLLDINDSDYLGLANGRMYNPFRQSNDREPAAIEVVPTITPEGIFNNYMTMTDRFTLQLLTRKNEAPMKFEISGNVRIFDMIYHLPLENADKALGRMLYCEFDQRTLHREEESGLKQQIHYILGSETVIEDDDWNTTKWLKHTFNQINVNGLKAFRSVDTIWVLMQQAKEIMGAYKNFKIVNSVLSTDDVGEIQVLERQIFEKTEAAEKQNDSRNTVESRMQEAAQGLFGTKYPQLYIRMNLSEMPKAPRKYDPTLDTSFTDQTLIPIEKY
jgi:hypothetical protein